MYVQRVFAYALEMFRRFDPLNEDTHVFLPRIIDSMLKLPPRQHCLHVRGLGEKSSPEDFGRLIADHD